MGKVIENILKMLQFQAETTVNLLDIYMSLLKYPASYQKAKQLAIQGPIRFKKDWAEMYRQKQAFYSLLNQLKRDGLIVKNKNNKQSIWHITKVGLKRLARIKKRGEDQPLPNNQYRRHSGGVLTIIAFDVPECERRKRSWLRTALASLGFSKLQQSVWVGRTRIPEDFIRDLKNLRMMPFVHIFSVDKKGTILQKT